MIATQNDVAKVEKKVLEIETSLDDIRRNQAEIGVMMEELTENILAVNGTIEEYINTLSNRMGGLEKKYPGKTSAFKNTGSKRTPTKINSSGSKAKEIYDLAYNDYVKGNYSLAVMGFAQMLEMYPDDVLAAKAQYWKGECYFSQEKWDKAVVEFKKVESGFKGTPEMREAMYKRALVLLKLRQDKKAVAVFDQIIKKYPLSQEALNSKEEKKSLSSQ